MKEKMYWIAIMLLSITIIIVVIDDYRMHKAIDDNFINTTKLIFELHEKYKQTGNLFTLSAQVDTELLNRLVELEKIIKLIESGLEDFLNEGKIVTIKKARGSK